MNTRSDVKSVIREVSGWEGITASPHRFGGVEFTLGKVEIGHIHRNGMVDIPFTRKLRERLVAEGHAERHHLLDESGWITFYMRGEGDADHAVRLFRLSYVQKGRRRGVVSADGDALASVGFSEAITSLLLSANADPE